MTKSWTESTPYERRLRFVLPPVGASPLPPEEQTAPARIVTCQNYCNLLLQFAKFISIPWKQSFKGVRAYEKKLHPMIFKRKSFHLFKNIGSISQRELSQIEESFRRCQPLIPEIPVEMKIVPAAQTTCQRGQEYCILLYSEKREGYLPNIGYIGQQLDLMLASMNIGSLWFGIGKAKVRSESGLDFVIMLP